jgi:hypothetical protein
MGSDAGHISPVKNYLELFRSMVIDTRACEICTMLRTALAVGLSERWI